MILYMSLLLFLIGLYLLPSLAVLVNRNATTEDRCMVALLNVLFGWTLLGWVLLIGLAGVDFQGVRARNRLRNQAPAPSGFQSSRPVDTSPSC